MFLKKKSNVIFKDYKTFGFITDNRNFSYKLSNINDNNIGDKILSDIGSIFFSVLDKKPQTINELTKKIHTRFSDVNIDIIKKDAVDFYYMLERDGFIVVGDTLQECEEKDMKFSYKTIEHNILKKDSIPTNSYLTKDTQTFFEEYFKGEPQLTNVHIEITSMCNERCLHCYIPHENKLSFISPELFYDIIQQCKEMRLIHLTLSGGEPMLHRNFCDFLRKCNEYDFSVNVLSNLTLLTDKIISEMTTMSNIGVQVTLFSMNPIIHDEITQMKGSLKKTISAITKLIGNDIPLQISCPIIKQNKNCYRDVIEWANKYRIQVGDDFTIIARYNHTTQNLSCRLSINEIKEVIYEKYTNDPKYLKQIEITAENKKNITSNDFVCSVCHSSLCIAENGNVYPCAGWNDFVVGNVKEVSLKDIWCNSEKIKYLRGIRNKDFPKCIQCPDKNYCTMCMVRNANENPFGDPLKVSEYFCDIANLNRRISYSSVR